VLLSLLSSVCVAVGSTSLVCAVRSVSKTLAREPRFSPILDSTEGRHLSCVVAHGRLGHLVRLCLDGFQIKIIVVPLYAKGQDGLVIREEERGCVVSQEGASPTGLISALILV